MKKIEFNTVLNVTRLYNPLSLIQDENGSAEKVHYWAKHSITMCFSTSGYAIINGEIPQKIVEELSKEEQTDKVGIIFNGNVLKNQEHSTYGCRIYTKEGLIAFIYLMKAYGINQPILSISESSNYKSLLRKVNAELLKEINPTISHEDWLKRMLGDGIDSRKATDRPALKLLRAYVEEFDGLVLPFANKKYSIEAAPIIMEENYGDAILSIDSLGLKNKDGIPNCYMTIQPSDSACMSYARDEESIRTEFEILFDVGAGSEILWHRSYITTIEKNRVEEVFGITRFLPDGSHSDTIINMSEGTLTIFANNSCKRKVATDTDYIAFCNAIDEANKEMLRLLNVQESSQLSLRRPKSTK